MTEHTNRTELTRDVLRTVIPILVPLVLFVLLISGIVIFLILPGYSYTWTGFAEYTNAKGEIQQAKTLWDWLQLLGIPIVLAVVAFFFSRAERNAERNDADRRDKIQREVSLDQTRESALQAYFDRMTELILDRNLHGALPENEIHSIVRGRTRAVLSQLDGRRKGTVVQFLYAADLLGSVVPHEPETTRKVPIVYLGEATDLNQVILSRSTLWGINLELTDMKEAILTGIDLFGAILSGVNLSGATMSGVNLCQADLRVANLSGIKASGSVFAAADLRGANLKGAKFSDDVNYHNIKLSGAKYNHTTKWPSGFNIAVSGAVLED